ncbi:MAG: hypothetical protein WC544_00080 [Patescibacteria group bacterium]
MTSYHSWAIIFSIILLFLISFALTKTKVLTPLDHRRIWNFMLAGFALISAGLGLLLAISIDQQSVAHWYRAILWIHVESGIGMAVVAIIHFSWHIKYYLLAFKK